MLHAGRMLARLLQGGTFGKFPSPMEASELLYALHKEDLLTSDRPLGPC